MRLNSSNTNNSNPLPPPLLRMDKRLHPLPRQVVPTLYPLVGWQFKIQLVDVTITRIKPQEKSLGTCHRRYRHHNLLPYQHRCRRNPRHKHNNSNNLLPLLVRLPRIEQRYWPPNMEMGLSRRRPIQNLRISMEMWEQGTHCFPALRACRSLSLVVILTCILFVPLSSNPYATTSRPGTAQVSATPKAPVSTDWDPTKIPELQAEYQPIQDCLTSLVEALKNLGLVSVDKRLLGEGEKAVAVMLKRLARGEISDEIGEKLLHMCGYINAYDFRSAQNVQTALVNSDWRDHKDWLKGTKSLLQLATKKFAQ